MVSFIKRAGQAAWNGKNNAFFLFIILMAVMTVISRAADSLMVPQVVLGAFAPMELSYPLEVEGQIITEGKRAVYCLENLRVGKVCVQKHDIVKRGDLLFSVDLADLEEKIGQTEREIRKYDLQIADIEGAYQQQIKQWERNAAMSGKGVNGDGVLAVTADQGNLAYSEEKNLGAGESEMGDLEPRKDNSASLLRMDREDLQRLLEKLYALKDERGQIYAEIDGRVSDCSVSVGSIVTPEPAMVLEDFSQPFWFEGLLEEEDYLFAEEGTECSLELPDGVTVTEGVAIRKVTDGEDGGRRVTAKISSASVTRTGNAVLRFSQTSQKYKQCIPLSAIYSGRSGHYVIEILEEQTILGLRSVARHVPVTLLEENGEYAAVKGNVSGHDKIVIHAGKEIREGERVRIIEE